MEVNPISVIKGGGGESLLFLRNSLFGMMLPQSPLWAAVYLYPSPPTPLEVKGVLLVSVCLGFVWTVSSEPLRFLHPNLLISGSFELN